MSGALVAISFSALPDLHPPPPTFRHPSFLVANVKWLVEQTGSPMTRSDTRAFPSVQLTLIGCLSAVPTLLSTAGLSVACFIGSVDTVPIGHSPEVSTARQTLLVVV